MTNMVAKPGIVEKRKRLQQWQISGIQVVTFFIEGTHFGIEVMRVREIIRTMPTTEVPLSDDVICGLLNLRGQIVTTIDLRKRLGFKPAAEGNTDMNLIVNTDDGPMSLTFEKIGEVIDVAPGIMEPPPANLDIGQAGHLTGVCKLDSGLLLLLDVEEVIST